MHGIEQKEDEYGELGRKESREQRRVL